ncbi:MAG: hypothetical protein FJ315_09470, partial [SAR202 cluster bacterium]|nr:hypothetical protein [SAR202 cluster bacterium]
MPNNGMHQGTQGNHGTNSSSISARVPDRSDLNRHGTPLYTVSAGGLCAVADGFAVDGTDGLWFLSMVGSQQALKAVWASLLKEPPEPVWLIQGLEGAFVGDYRSASLPYETIGTWTTQIAKLSGCGGYHALVYPRLAEYAFEHEDFLLLARSEDVATGLHYRFLDRRVSLPLHPSWEQWLWQRGFQNGEIEALEGEGILAYRCRPSPESLRADLASAVAAGHLFAPGELNDRRNGHGHR